MRIANGNAWPVRAVRSLGWLAMTLPLLTGRSQAQLAGPLSVDQVVGARYLSTLPPAVSPNGESVALVVYDPRRYSTRRTLDYVHSSPYAQADLHIADVHTGRMKTVVDDNAAHWGPSWSPDGRTLAFFSDHDSLVRIWLWDAATRKARKLTEAPLVRGGVGWYAQWSADGRSILASFAPDGRPVLTYGTLDSVPDVQVFRVDGTDSIAAARVGRNNEGAVTASLARRADLALIDVATGHTTTIARDVRADHFWLSPAGDFVAYVSIDTVLPVASLAFGMYVVGKDGKPPRLVAHLRRPQNGGTPLYYDAVSWSPDGRYLSYRDEAESAGGDYYVVEMARGEPAVRVTPAPHAAFRARLLLGAQWEGTGRALYLIGGDTVWRADVGERRLQPVGAVPGRELVRIIGSGRKADVWSPDGGGSLYVVTRNRRTLRMGIARCDIRTGATQQLIEDDRLISSSAIDVSGRRLVYAAESAKSPLELWTAMDGLSAHRRLTTVDSLWSRVALGETRLVSWRNLHGEELNGVLMLPAAYVSGRRYPLIVAAYPSSRVAWALNHFGFNATSGPGANMQLFASRGYAVLIADLPLRTGVPMFDIAADVLPGVDRVIEMGIADPQRLGTMGYSNGGYVSLALITQTPRFKAAVVRAGISDLFSSAASASPASGTSFWLRNETAGTVGGSLWNRPLAYIQNSPIYSFDRIETPILLTNGTTDTQVPVHLADQTYQALRRAGKTTVYARYEGEGHGTSGWSFVNARDELTRVVDWLDAYLKPGTPTATATSAVRDNRAERSASGRSHPE